MHVVSFCLRSRPVEGKVLSNKGRVVGASIFRTQSFRLSRGSGTFDVRFSAHRLGGSRHVACLCAVGGAP